MGLPGNHLFRQNLLMKGLQALKIYHLNKLTKPLMISMPNFARNGTQLAQTKDLEWKTAMKFSRVIFMI